MRKHLWTDSTHIDQKSTLPPHFSFDKKEPIEHDHLGYRTKLNRLAAHYNCTPLPNVCIVLFEFIFRSKSLTEPFLHVAYLNDVTPGAFTYGNTLFQLSIGQKINVSRSKLLCTPPMYPKTFNRTKNVDSGKSFARGMRFELENGLHGICSVEKESLAKTKQMFFKCLL